jgi:hypothetical protein
MEPRASHGCRRAWLGSWWCRCPARRPGVAAWTSGAALLSAPNGLAVLYGLGLERDLAASGTTTFCASVPGRPRGLAADERDLNALRPACSDVGIDPRPAAVIDHVAPGELLVNDVVRVRCGRFYSGRVVLVGDCSTRDGSTRRPGGEQRAGGRCSPRRGTGARPRRRGCTPDLRSRRGPRVRYAQRSADLMTFVSELRSPWARRLRDSLIPSVLRIGSGLAGRSSGYGRNRSSGCTTSPPPDHQTSAEGLMPHQLIRRSRALHASSSDSCDRQSDCWSHPATMSA